MSNDYKKQHYVPCTYLDAWKNPTGRVKVYDKNNNTLCKDLKPKKIFFGLDFYTKGYKDVLILNREDKEEIFSVLQEYSITYKDKNLCDVDDYAVYYRVFDEWQIKTKEGGAVKRKQLKDLIEGKRIVTLETGWHEIEDRWGALKNRVLEAIEKGTDLAEEDANSLIEFMVVQNHRTPEKLKEYEEIAKDMFEKLGLAEAMGEHYEAEVKEISEALFLGQIDKFQSNSEEGVIQKEIDTYIERGHLCFWKANGNKFFTSDSPVTLIIDERRLNPSKYNGIYFPITPDIMLALYRGIKQYSVKSIGAGKVRKFNNIIREKAVKYYIKVD